MVVTSITVLPRGPTGVPLIIELDQLREQAEGLVINGTTTRVEMSLAVLVVALVDKIYDMNYELEDILEPDLNHEGIAVEDDHRRQEDTGGDDHQEPGAAP